MSQFSYKVCISPSVISQEVSLGETILMDVKTLAYFGLDEFGSRVWSYLESCTDAQQVFENLKSATNFDEEALARKYGGILKGMEMSGIVSLEPQ